MRYYEFYIALTVAKLWTLKFFKMRLLGQGDISRLFVVNRCSYDGPEQISSAVSSLAALWSTKTHSTSFERYKLPVSIKRENIEFNKKHSIKDCKSLLQCFVLKLKKTKSNSKTFRVNKSFSAEQQSY